MSVQPGQRYDPANETQFRRDVDVSTADLRRRVGELESATVRDLGTVTSVILPANAGRFFVAQGIADVAIAAPTGGRPGTVLLLFLTNSGGSAWTVVLDPAFVPRAGWVAPILQPGDVAPVTLVHLGAPGWTAF